MSIMGFLRQATRSMLTLMLLMAPIQAGERHEWATIQGKVIGVADGDTLTILINRTKTSERIRLYGIDAPESRQDFGTKAKQALSQLVFGKQVAVQYRERDRYGRIVGKVYQDAVYVNLAQVKAGMAWHYTAF